MAEKKQKYQGQNQVLSYYVWCLYYVSRICGPKPNQYPYDWVQGLLASKS